MEIGGLEIYVGHFFWLGKLDGFAMEIRVAVPANDNMHVRTPNRPPA